jgi:hypothetical protein
MRYLCLIYEDEKSWENASQADMEKAMGAYYAFDDSIKKSGHHRVGEALQPTNTATTVRVRNGKISTTDGPYVETKEQLGGFYLIEARDLNDAIQVAARIPSAQTGGVEVRPIQEFPPQE